MPEIQGYRDFKDRVIHFSYTQEKMQTYNYEKMKKKKENRCLEADL